MTDKLEKLKTQASLESRANPALFNTVIKEGLHRDILTCLAKSDLGKDVVFQGGTALRLCYNNNRYSEDLDFVSPGPVDLDAIARFKVLITKLIKDDYGATVDFKNPKEAKGPTNATGIDVKRWAVKIELGSMEGTLKTKQQIHVEIAEGIPALDARPTAIHRFTASPVGQPPVIMHVSSREEILADKFVAVIGRQYFKARDIWDIKFLLDSGVKVKPEWVLEKCKQYGIADDAYAVSQMMIKKASDLASPITAEAFKSEMTRFLSRSEVKTWIEQEFGTESILMEAGNALERVANLLERMEVESNSSVSALDKIKAWRDKHGHSLEDKNDAHKDQGPSM